MTEVERFFRRLVSALATSDPARLQSPLLLDDITGSILPYRTHRRALELDTVEDYEAVLLRLCAGEGDLVWAEPEEARERFVAESRRINPDLTALYAFENVYLSVRPEPLLWALAPDPRADYAPPAPPEASPEPEEPLILGTAQLGIMSPPEEPESEEPEFEEPEPSLADEIVEATELPRPTCLYCGGSLPTNRTVNFCPHCGQDQTRILCPQCRSEVEPGWRHCVNCGAGVGEA